MLSLAICLFLSFSHLVLCLVLLHRSYYEKAKIAAIGDVDKEGKNGRSRSLAYELAVAWMHKLVSITVR